MIGPKHLLLFLAFLMLGFVLTAKAADKPQIYAVVVGITNYQDKNIQGLKYPEKDATEFYNVLRSPICGSVPEENVALLVGVNATRANVMKEVYNKFSRAQSNDLIIFYFSGHGVGGEFENDGFLLGYDTDTQNESPTSISMDEVRAKIDRSLAKMKVSYIDACHAALFKSNAKGSAADDNAAIVTAVKELLSDASDGNVGFVSCSARQKSIEDDKLKHGLFTFYLLEGLKGGADKFKKTGSGGNNDGVVTIGELASYLTTNVEAGSKSKQRPSVIGIYDDEFPLSVVTPNASIKDFIAARPPRKVKASRTDFAGKAGVIAGIAKSEWDLSDKKVSPDGSNFAFAYYSFINELKEPVMIHMIDNTCQDCNIVIGPGKKARTPKLITGTVMKDGTIRPSNTDYRVWFRTIDKNKPIRYGLITIDLDNYIEKSLVLDENTLNLDEKNRKY